MNSLIDSALSHSRMVIASLVLILISGAVSYMNIAKEAEPDVNIPIIYVSMHHDGISPEDAERLLIRPMEQELRVIEGVKEMRASAFEGGGNVTLEFEAGFDADKALTDVRKKVDLAKPELPSESDEPEVHEVNISLFPVVVVALSGAIPERALLKIARDLKDNIEGISSILKVTIAGDRDEMVEILIDPIKIESYGLSPIDTVNAIRSSNLLVAAGAQDTGRGRFSLKVPGLFESSKDIMQMPIMVDGDAVVTLGDIGEVRRSFKDPDSFARVDGKTAVTLEVSKRTGENIIKTIAMVQKVVADQQAIWPKTLQGMVGVSYLNDKSDIIRERLNDLQNSVIAAIVLVMIVVVAALGLRTATLVGIAIPGSFLAGILVLYANGFTINMIVLFGLILAVGMLVDGAIVVTEYADRKMTEGETPKVAYGMAAKRMAWPIIASTATTLAAFLPLLYWPGIVGEFMKYLPITLIATLSASLFMALIFIPTLGSVFGKAAGTAELNTVRGLSGNERDSVLNVSGFTGTYISVLAAALRHPAKLLFLSVILLGVIFATFANVGKGVEFFPDVEPEFAKLQVKARGNLSVLEKDQLMAQVEKRIIALNDTHHEIDTIYLRTGGATNSNEAEDIIGTVSLEFSNWDKRRKAEVILAEIQTHTNDLAGIIIDRRVQESGPPVGKAFQLQLSSRAPEAIAPMINKVLQGLNQIGGFINVEDSRPLPGIDWVLTTDRAQAAKFGASVDLIGRTIQLVTTGIKLGEYRPDDSDDELDIRARYPKSYRTIDHLDDIRSVTPMGQIPLSNFVKRNAKPHTGKLQRSDGKRVMTIKADVVEGQLPDNKVKEVVAWLKTANLDSRVSITFKGENEEQKKAQQFLSKAFGVALFIMAVILVTQFNSFYSAGLILFAVVMSTGGVLIGLMITDQPFGIVMNGISVIALAGIVVNNNIVLIDTYDRLKKTEIDALTAILKTGAQRLRPVLLTTITTILGLLPMVLGANIDFFDRTVQMGAPSSQWWQQLSTAIVYGLGFATILTLLITPAALMMRANVRAWLDHKKAKK